MRLRVVSKWIALIQEHNIPLLGLVPSGQKGNRDEDDNSLASVANLDLRILVSA